MIAFDLPMQLRLVVTTGPGRLRYLPPRRFENGVEMVEEGQPVARIEHAGGETVLRAPVTGAVSSILAFDGVRVVPGRPVMAIDPRPIGDVGAAQESA